jgi:hypothetical protein
MVRVSSHASRILKYLGPADSLELRAGREAITHGYYPVLQQFTFDNEGRNANTRGNNLDNAFTSSASTAIALCGSLFPAEEAVAYALAEFLSLSPSQSLKKIDAGTLVEDLPLVRAVKTVIQESCPCFTCLCTARSTKQV